MTRVLYFILCAPQASFSLKLLPFVCYLYQPQLFEVNLYNVEPAGLYMRKPRAHPQPGCSGKCRLLGEGEQGILEASMGGGE